MGGCVVSTDGFIIRYIFKLNIFDFFMIPIEDYLSANIIDFLRNTYGDNNRKIGEKIGASESLICLVANGKRSLTIERFLAIEKAYQISLPNLISNATDLDNLSPKMRKLYVGV